MSVADCQERIGSREFAEWLAYDRLDPIGRERLDLHAGIVACTIANVHRSRSTRTYEPSDFMPRYDRPVVRQSQEEIRRRFEMWAAGVNKHYQKHGGQAHG